MKRNSIGQFVKKINVTVQILRNWDHTDKPKPDYVSPSRHSYYSQKQLYYFLGLHRPETEQKIIIGYCRVSSNKQKDDLERQVENRRTYPIQQGKRANKSKEIIKELREG